MSGWAEVLEKTARSAHAAWNLYAATSEGANSSRLFGLESGPHDKGSFEDCRHGHCIEARVALVDRDAVSLDRELAEQALAVIEGIHEFNEWGARHGREMGCATCCVIAELRDELTPATTKETSDG